jgi:hypothetical protein
MVASFSVIVIVWSKMAFNLWQREEGFYMVLWNLTKKGHSEDERGVVRPSFMGDFVPSCYDSNMLEKQYPQSKLFGRWLLASLCVLLCCAIAMVANNMWFVTYQGRISTLGTCMVVMQMKVFELTWNYMAPILTQFENHKFESTYHNSFLWKHFLFRFVNAYGTFFYVAVNLRYTKAGCPERGCLVLLREQLIIIQILHSISNIIFTIALSYKVDFTLWQEEYALRRSGGASIYDAIFDVHPEEEAGQDEEE